VERASRREKGLADPGTFHPRDLDLTSRDPLGFPNYSETLEQASVRSETDESVVAGAAEIEGHPVELALFSFDFIGGSMGEVAGERVARSLERAAERGVPFVLRTSTGGARMQEGMRSLIQMPKVVAARMALASAHQPFIACLGHPTTGGVLASVASLADLTLAEGGATIGFAGPRVAERVTGEPLPRDSHTASAALQNGAVDEVVPSERARARIAEILRCLAPDDPQGEPGAPRDADRSAALDGWEAVRRARAPKQLSPEDMFDEYVEVNGDRAGGAARELRAWLARIEGRRALVLDTGGNMLSAAAFRKGLRCVEIAGRLRIPLVTLVDTPGADPSAQSERQGIASLIARTIEAMLDAPTPVLAVVTGEGGSGGALAFATGDALIAFETAVFSVIAPEGAAEILWKDAGRASEAARLLKIGAHDLETLGIADSVVGGSPSADSVRRVVTYHLDRMGHPSGDPSPERRLRWRNTW
jgi:acyl-CoA carboxylase subunit beta